MNEDNTNTQGENNAPVQSDTPTQSAPVQGSNESPMQEYKNFYANGGKRNKAAVIALAIVCPLALAVVGTRCYLCANRTKNASHFDPYVINYLGYGSRYFCTTRRY